MSTAVFFSTFNKKPILEIWKLDENGQKVGTYPIISFGLVKANAIVEHMDTILAWINTQ